MFTGRPQTRSVVVTTRSLDRAGTNRGRRSGAQEGLPLMAMCCFGRESGAHIGKMEPCQLSASRSAVGRAVKCCARPCGVRADTFCDRTGCSSGSSLAHAVGTPPGGAIAANSRMGQRSSMGAACSTGHRGPLVRVAGSPWKLATPVRRESELVVWSSCGSLAGPKGVHRPRGAGGCGRSGAKSWLTTSTAGQGPSSTRFQPSSTEAEFSIG
jgi:hypothetical protein